MGPVNVKIQLSRRSQPFIVHVDKLKLCLSETPRSWLDEALETEQLGGGFAPMTGESVKESLPDVPEVDEEKEAIPVSVPDYVEPESGEVCTPGPGCCDDEEVALPQRPSRKSRRLQRLADFV